MSDKTYEDIIDSTAVFLKNHFEDNGVPLTEIPPQFTLFDIYDQEGEMWAYHALPFFDLSEEDGGHWGYYMKKSLLRHNLKNLVFFGIVEVNGEDNFFIVCYFGDEDSLVGRYYNLELEDQGEFPINEAFPFLSTINFKEEDVVH